MTRAQVAASADRLEGLASVVSGLDAKGMDERGALDAITALERLKRAACAAQAALSVRVDELARARQRQEGVPTKQWGQGVGTEIALARMESPHRGGRHLGLATALVAELPQTLAGMTVGVVSEWQATLVARETACLDPETRRAVDERIAGRIGTWGDGQTVREVRKLVYAADPGGVVARHARAAEERCVTIRPAPDTMCYLTALVPAVQGVAAYAALLRDADQARAIGDARSKGQVMADTLVERTTGQSTASDVPVEVGVVMNAEALLADSAAPAHLVGYGPLPAVQARRLVRDSEAEVWVRRLYARPDTGRLVSMDSRRRRFTGQLRHFVVIRDQFCRTPWCDAPIRHTDHPTPHRGDGQTSEDNAQGLCEACNYAKEAPGWSVRATGSERHLVSITTPTGHTYASQAPDPPGCGPGLPSGAWRVEAPGVWSVLPRAG